MLVFVGVAVLIKSTTAGVCFGCRDCGVDVVVIVLIVMALSLILLDFMFLLLLVVLFICTLLCFFILFSDVFDFLVLENLEYKLQTIQVQKSECLSQIILNI